MTLEPGTRLGSYEIVSALGSGGMGEVYRARDTKLNRDVALKILPDAFSVDGDRIARFRREAQVLASLNHPNIAAIYGFEDSGSTHALVLELVEGPTLADRIARGPIPLDETLPIARQIAEALESAHEQGIIHRDLKPANIKVRGDGTVKVLDFGLAKALEPASAISPMRTAAPTITTPAMTQMGVILGTAAYMSPEQARGGAADRRSDLWAFGCVLYEMLTGARLFEGATISDTLASVLKTDPDWTQLPSETSTPIRRFLRRSLEKDRRRRLADAADARLDIEDAIANPLADARARPTPRRTLSIRVAVPFAIVTVVVAVMFGVWLRPAAVLPPRTQIARVVLPLEAGTELADGQSVAISADGTQVAYVARRSGISELYLRPINGLEARVIRDTRGVTAPFFSPDGRWLGFSSGGNVAKVSTSGGVVTTLTEGTGAPGAVAGNGDWGLDGTIAFVSRGQIATVPSGGGEVRVLTASPKTSPVVFRSVQFLPGGEALLVSSSPRGARSAEEASIDVLAVKTGQRKTLLSGSTLARYLPSGHVVFLRSGRLMAAPFDLARLELSAPPVEVMSAARQQLYTGEGAFACSRDGTCVYVAGATAGSRTLVLVDRSGVARPLPLPQKSYTTPRFSPGGDRISWWVEQFQCDIEVYDVTRGTVARVASDSDNHYPIWAPDGRRLVYVKNQSGEGYAIVSKPANGNESEELLPGSPKDLPPLVPLSESSTGLLAFANRFDIWLLAPGEREPRPFLTSTFRESDPALSPDGRWLAYTSDESGRVEVYVRPVPGPGEKYLISTTGGSEPVWARTGRELFFRNGDQMMAVDIGAKAAFGASRPRVLFTGSFSRHPSAINYDVSPDGQSFVMINAGEDERAVTQINVITNWFEELKQRVPVK